MADSKITIGEKEDQLTTMLFCPECNNMLYPKEDRAEKKLMYSCPNCGHREPAPQNCVYVNEVVKASSENVTINKHIILDKTLPRTRDMRCPNCDHDEVAFFTPIDNSMRLMYVCCNPDCVWHWLQNIG